MLLGLLRESKALSTKIFPGPTFTIVDLLKEVEKHATIGKKVATSVDLPLTKSANTFCAMRITLDRLGINTLGRNTSWSAYY